MNEALRILMILTSQATMGSGGAPTGVWFEELTTPYYAFVDAGVEVDIASPNGGRIPLDPHSLKPAGQNPPSVERFMKDPAAMRKIEHAQRLDGVEAPPTPPSSCPVDTAPCGISPQASNWPTCSVPRRPPARSSPPSVTAPRAS